MTEDTTGHILCILDELYKQRVKVAALVQEATQDYVSAVEAREMGAKAKAFTEMKHYADAYAALKKAIAILREVKEGKL